MNWRFWRRPIDVGVPENIRRKLTDQFNVQPQAIESMRCIFKEAILAGQSVRFVRVFDPAAINGSAPPIGGYDALSVQRRAILFEGHIEKSGYTRLVDRRPQRAFPTVSKRDIH